MDASPLTATAPLPLANCYWVVPGRLLAGEYPAGEGVAVTRNRLRRLFEAGINCFVDLTEAGEIAPYEAELPSNVDYFHKPLPDHGVPRESAQMGEVLDCLRDALRAARCVYLHCRAGIGRTGTVVGCYLVERGLPGDEALTELNRLWQASGKAALWPQVPETPEQMAYVRGWVRSGADPLFDT